MKNRFGFMPATVLIALALLSAVCADARASSKDCLPPEPIGHHSAPLAKHPFTSGAAAMIAIDVDEKGRVLNPQLERSSGDKDYDGEALNTVRSWQFKPSTCAGKPIRVRLEITMQPGVTH
ncbi:MAG: energy transducer TonB [Candidatus Sulfotelmatobacter sp.]